MLQAVKQEMKVYLYRIRWTPSGHVEEYLKPEYFDWQNELDTIDKLPSVSRYTGRAIEFDSPGEAYDAAAPYKHLQNFCAGRRYHNAPYTDMS